MGKIIFQFVCFRVVSLSLLFRYKKHRYSQPGTFRYFVPPAQGLSSGAPKLRSQCLLTSQVPQSVYYSPNFTPWKCISYMSKTITVSSFLIFRRCWPWSWGCRGMIAEESDQHTFYPSGSKRNHLLPISELKPLRTAMLPSQLPVSGQMSQIFKGNKAPPVGLQPQPEAQPRFQVKMAKISTGSLKNNAAVPLEESLGRQKIYFMLETLST